LTNHRSILATALGIAACHAGHRVLFATARRRCRFFTSCGSKLAVTVAGTSICTSPQLSDSTVFDRFPFRELARFRPSTACLS
jgi:hypothetical protein